MEKQDYLGLHNLISVKGARKSPKRLGRGESSGLGKTSTRGHKGQKARKSGNVRPGFEGGQNPLARRLPKRGFTNSPFRSFYSVVNLGAIGERFKAGALVDCAALVAVGLIPAKSSKVKVLAKGTLSVPVQLKVSAISAAAKASVEKAGGSVELAN